MTIPETYEFEFPAEPTRLERASFAENAGCTLQRLGTLLTEGRLDELTPQMEAALILIAARRVDPRVTFAQAMANDGWTLAEPADDGGDE